MNAQLFCTVCNKSTPHRVSVAKNGEFDFHCECGHFVRAPKGSPDDVKRFIADHNKHNVVKVTDRAQEDAEASLQALKAAGVVT